MRHTYTKIIVEGCFDENEIFSSFGNSIRELFQNVHKVLLRIRMDTDTMADRHLHDFVGTTFTQFCMNDIHTNSLLLSS